MARLNIYVPDDLYSLAERWRSKVNLSAICSKALREELDAADSARAAPGLFRTIQAPSSVERKLKGSFKLVDAVVCEVPEDQSELRAGIGKAAAQYLDGNLTDGSFLAIAGGRQTWCAVRELTPRRLRITITAMGIDQHDPKVLHVHPNTLTTLLWLLYSPRAEAHLVGSTAFQAAWNISSESIGQEPRYFVLASCAPFDRNSPFSRLLGDAVVRSLEQVKVAGDYAYTFFGADGSPRNIEALHTPASTFSHEALVKMAARADSRIILVAGGADKLPIIQHVLHAELCNVLITDSLTAQQLLSQPKERSRRSRSHS
jgi:DNA-binding transcriptional regulator LsrR (DeoR family)